MKKNNKGFSLVELIVVILIMAILGVALTPQVMKWVNNSRISSDVTNYEALVSAAQLTLADENVNRIYINGTTTTAVTINWNSGTAPTFTDDIDTTDKTFEKKFKAVFPDCADVKAKTGSYTIIIKRDGTITRDTTLENKRNSVN